MLELIMGGAVVKSATIAVNTYSATPGTTLTFTVSTKNIKNGELVYWGVLSDSGSIVGLTPTSGSGTPVNDKFTFTLPVPSNSTNTGKTFRIGIALNAASVSDPITAMAVTLNITMQAIPTPKGQVNYLAAGTYSLRVPSGVTAMSFYGVGAGGGGGKGNTSYRGSGGTAGTAGAKNYVNTVSVTPGETLTITVGAGGVAGTSSAAPGAGAITTIKRGTTVLLSCDAGVAGVNGKASGGSESGNYGQWGTDGVAIPGVPTASVPTDPKARPGAGGLGSDGYGPGTSSKLTGDYPGAGVAGGVRAIWGDNRRFPSTNVADMS